MFIKVSDFTYFLKKDIYRDIIIDILEKNEYKAIYHDSFKTKGGFLFIDTQNKTFYIAIGSKSFSKELEVSFLEFIKGY